MRPSLLWICFKMAKSVWMQRHLSDQYVKAAQQDGYVSRAAYKLLAIQEKDHFIRPGMTVLDLGAAPGGWSQVALALLKDQGQVIALDRLPLKDISGVQFIQGDFTEQSVLDALMETLGGRPVDVIISDMAPNLSGQKQIDQPRAMYLAELVWETVQQTLAPGGSFLIKLFEGEGVPALRLAIKKQFKSVKSRKPEASRASSREFYLLAQGYIGYTGS